MSDKKLDFTKFDLESYVSKFATRDSKSRDGDAWFNCCFHDENTPSLHVTGKQVYHCHGCGASGGILDFVKQANGISTKEALEIISDESGQESVAVEVVMERKPFILPTNVLSTYSYNSGFVYKYKTPDSFLWANYSDDEWWFGTGDYEIELYAPNGLEGLVVLAEGEKDADTLCDMGFNGASSPNGTYKWKDSYTESLKGADKVVLLNDNDQQGIWGVQLCQRYLKEAGIMTKRISPIDLEPFDKKGYDISDVTELLGEKLTTQRLQYLIDQEDGWNQLWDEIEPEKETLEVEVVWESGLGEDYDNLINKAVQETLQDGDVSELTYLEMTKQAKETGLGLSQIKKRVKDRVKEVKKSEVAKIKPSAGVKIADLDINLDIRGSGYIVSEETSAIWDEQGDEVIGHFLSFVGVVTDAEKEQDTDTKVALAYNTPQDLKNIRLLIIPKKNIATTLDLIKTLSGYNINVTQNNAMQVVKYLQDLQNHFKENTLIMKSLSRFGWFENKLMPYERELAGVVFDQTVKPEVTNALLDQKGDKEKSLELIREIAQRSESSALLIGAMVGSLVLSYTNEGGNQSFAFNVYAETSTGKTVTTQAISSMFGLPFTDGGWWVKSDSTVQRDAYHNALMGNLPTFVDDPATHRGYVGVDKQDYIYSVTSGESRGRMRQDGMNAQDTKNWCNVMIMTNETMFIDASIQAGGARSRCIEVPFNDILDEDTVKRWVSIYEHNYGHFAIDIANKIRQWGKPKLNQHISEYIKWFGEKGVEGKRALNSSIIMVGLAVAVEALDLDAIMPQEWLAKQIINSGSVSDGERAYNKLIDMIQVSGSMFREIYDKNGKVSGCFGTHNGDKVLSIPKHILTEYCKELDINIESLINWGYKNGKFVPHYSDTGKPTTISLYNYLDTFNCYQIYYEWIGKQTNEMSSSLVFKEEGSQE